MLYRLYRNAIEYVAITQRYGLISIESKGDIGFHLLGGG